MSDFRKKLYQGYVTKFKIEQTRMDERTIKSFWAWYEYKYLPLLEGLDRNSLILELGCGPGYLLGFLKNRGFSRVEGIDISEEQIRIAAGCGLNVKVADAFDYLSSKQEAFHAIIAIDFIEHFNKEEIFRLIPSIHRALKQDGILIIQTPNGQGIFPNQVVYGDLSHLTVFTPDSLKQILTLVGFDGLRFYETGPVPKRLKGKIRTILWRLIKKLTNTIRIIETGKKQEIWTENLICFCRKPSPTQTFSVSEHFPKI